MKVTLIGSHLCPDTLYAINRLCEAGVEMEFKNISASLNALNLFTVSAKELKGQHPSQQGFDAISMSIRPQYSVQFSVTF